MNFKFLSTFILVLFSLNHSIGQVTFQKTYGGANSDNASIVQQTNDGGYIIGGFTKSYGAGNFDNYLIKTNEFGDTLWTRVMGDAFYNKINCLKQTADGGYVLTGFTDYDVFLIKTDFQGFVQWKKKFGFSQTNGGHSVFQTQDGGYSLTGLVFTGNPSNAHSFLIKTDALGITSWIKIYGGVLSNMGSSAIPTIDGGYFLTGCSPELNVGSWNDFVIIKTDASGDTLWTKKFGFPGGHEFAYGAIELPDGYLISGHGMNLSGNNGLFLMKIDLNGNQSWCKSYPGGNSPMTSAAPCVVLNKNTDGGFIINSYISSGHGMSIIRTDSSGNILFVHNLEGITGTTTYFGSGSPTLDGGYVLTGTTNWLGAGNYDMKLIKMDSLGFSGCYESNLFDTAFSFVFPQNPYALLVDTIAELITPLDYSYSSGGIVTTQCTTVGLNDDENINSVSIESFPNPFTDEITVQNTNIGATIILFDATGRKVLEKIATDVEIILDTQKLNNGFYWIQYNFKGKIESLKVVKL